MSIQRSQEDSWTKEMQQWEMRPVLVNGTYIEPIPFDKGGRGGAPHQEYPKMLYKADSFDGGTRISGMLTVDDEGRERLECSRGWSVTQQEAIDRVGAQELEFARLAANRAYTDRLMSGKAQAEAQAIDETTVRHLPAIPVTPIARRKPGPKAKTAASVAAEGSR